MSSTEDRLLYDHVGWCRWWHRYALGELRVKRRPALTESKGAVESDQEAMEIMCYISYMSADACRTGTAAEADVPARFKVHSL